MGVLQHFERRLEGAVEGFFARAFRSGLQPIELAKALQRYAEDTQHVTEDGVVVPNVYRFNLNPRDLERFETLGEQLPRELADVVARTADERGWRLRGPVVVRLHEDGQVSYGMYQLAARVEAAQAPAVPPGASPATTPDRPAPAAASAAAGTVAIPAATGRPRHGLRVVRGRAAGSPETVQLSGDRVVAGRLPNVPVTLEEPTVSREHAAFVLRGTQWWVVDLGSTNGTRVNGATAAEHPLSPGDRIELGEALVEFVET